MVYAMSDIHGCYDKYIAMLEKINFRAEDTLYVLGDVLDRGPDGFKVLLDLASRPNVVVLRGNHEAMAMRALPYILQTICSDKELTDTAADTIELWFHNGGETSLEDFLLLDAEQAVASWEYLHAMPLYQEIEVDERKFVLLHGGLKNFSLNRKLKDYDPNQIVWCRPEANTVYYPDKCVLIGHTPTPYLYAELGEHISEPRIFKKETFIDLDCGCVFGGRLGCLCLDTMEEFYV